MNPTDRKSFFSVLFVAAMDNFGFGIVFVMFAPLLLNPEYHLISPGTSIATRNIYLGILFAAYPLTQLFGAPILGDYADVGGRKKALFITILGSVFSFLLSGVALLFSSLWGLIISRLISGFFGGNLSICLSAIADLSPSEKLRARNFAIVTVIWSLSWTFAMLTGGYLSDPSKSALLSPALPFWVTAFLTFLSLIGISKYYTETHQPHKNPRFNFIKGIHNIRHAFTMKTVRPFFFVIFAWTIGWGLSVQWFATYSILQYKASQLGISWSLLIQGLFWMAGGLFVNPLLHKRLHTLPITIIAFAFCALFITLCSFPTAFMGFIILYWISATFSAFAFSNSMNLISINASNAVQGKIMGLSQSMMSLGWVIVPIFGGYLGGKNAAWFYPISAFILFLGLLVLLSQWRKKRTSPS